MQNSAYCTSFILKTKLIWFSYGNWYFITYLFLIQRLIEKPGTKITSENIYLLLYSLTSTLYKCLSTAFSSDESASGNNLLYLGVSLHSSTMICVLCSGYFSTCLFTLTRSIIFWVFMSQGCFVTWIMCAAYTHCLNLKRWCLIYPQIDDIFQAAHHTHCHLEWVASLLFPWELLLISTYWRGPCCHDNSTDEYVNS